MPVLQPEAVPSPRYDQHLFGLISTEPMSPQAEATEPTTVSQAACRSAWARLIAKVYAIDPLLCPRCGSEMRLIAVISDPSEVRTILRHLVKIGRAPPGLDPSALN